VEGDRKEGVEAKGLIDCLSNPGEDVGGLEPGRAGR
jgi:hypothetical protein